MHLRCVQLPWLQSSSSFRTWLHRIMWCLSLTSFQKWASSFLLTAAGMFSDVLLNFTIIFNPFLAFWDVLIKSHRLSAQRTGGIPPYKLKICTIIRLFSGHIRWFFSPNMSASRLPGGGGNGVRRVFVSEECEGVARGGASCQPADGQWDEQTKVDGRLSPFRAAHLNQDTKQHRPVGVRSRGWWVEKGEWARGESRWSVTEFNTVLLRPEVPKTVLFSVIFDFWSLKTRNLTLINNYFLLTLVRSTRSSSAAFVFRSAGFSFIPIINENCWP